MHRKVFEDPRPLPGARRPLPNTSSSSSTTTQAPAAVPPFAAPPAESALDHLDQMLAQELISAAAKQAVQTGAMPKAVLPVGGAAGVGTSASASAMPSAAEMIDTSRRRTAARLDQLERLLKTQEAELRKRDREIQRQHDELRALRQENRDMHRFLADYGLQWVGGGATSEGGSSAGSAASSSAASVRPTPPATASGESQQQPQQPQQPPLPSARAGRRQPTTTTTTKAHAARGGGADAAAAATAAVTGAAGVTSPHTKAAGGPPEMERVRRAVDELNALAENGAGEVVRRRDGSHGFATPSMTLSFWSDGLQLDGSALRPYGAPEAVAFLRDLLDGFFPYELKHAYPEGVVFAVADHTGRSYGAPGEYEWGAGRKLDSRGDGMAAAGAAGGEAVAAYSAAPSAPSGRRPLAGAAMGGGERMWHNPVVGGAAEAEAGGVVGAGAFLCAGAADGADGNSAAQEGGSLGGGGGGGASSCRLQVKAANGQLACVLEFSECATLASVHAALLERSIVNAADKYELRTAFPSKCLTEPSRTLAALGLAPSATLCVRLV